MIDIKETAEVKKESMPTTKRPADIENECSPGIEFGFYTQRMC